MSKFTRIPENTFKEIVINAKSEIISLWENV